MFDFSSLYSRVFISGVMRPDCVESVIEPNDYCRNYSSRMVRLEVFEGLGIGSDVKLWLSLSCSISMDLNSCTNLFSLIHLD